MNESFGNMCNPEAGQELKMTGMPRTLQGGAEALTDSLQPGAAATEEVDSVRLKHKHPAQANITLPRCSLRAHATD